MTTGTGVMMQRTDRGWTDSKPSGERLWWPCPLHERKLALGSSAHLVDVAHHEDAAQRVHAQRLERLGHGVKERRCGVHHCFHRIVEHLQHAGTQIGIQSTIDHWICPDSGVDMSARAARAGTQSQVTSATNTRFLAEHSRHVSISLKLLITCTTACIHSTAALERNACTAQQALSAACQRVGCHCTL
jgi:hypothetical protein